MSLDGVEIGERQHSYHFYNDVVFLSARCLQAMDAADLEAPLGGLGIPTDFAVLMDGVPLGGCNLHGRHGSMEVICLNGVNGKDHRLRPRLIAWFVASEGHSGDALTTSALNALAASPST